MAALKVGIYLVDLRTYDTATLTFQHERFVIFAESAGQAEINAQEAYGFTWGRQANPSGKPMPEVKSVKTGRIGDYDPGMDGVLLTTSFMTFSVGSGVLSHQHIG